MYNKCSFLDIITQGAGILDLYLPDEALADFEQYFHYLTSWKKLLNLTSLNQPQDIAALHFLDSLTIFKVLPSAVSSLLDVGTGAGFPGLVLKIASPNLYVSLLDPNPKKIVFLKRLVAKLGLTDVHFLCSHIQELPYQPFFQHAFDAVIMRGLSLSPQQFSDLALLMNHTAVLIRMLGPKSLMTSFNMRGLGVAAYWAGYLPLVSAYRRVIAYYPLPAQ